MPRGIYKRIKLNKGMFKKGGHLPSSEIRKKITETLKKKYLNGYISPNRGSSRSKETKLKMSLAGKGRIPWNKDKKGWTIGTNAGFQKGHKDLVPIISRKEASKKMIGENHFNWLGGDKEYGVDWTDDLKDSIRKRDNYVCQLCGMHQDELDRKLHCHHIDYDKKNLNPENLITLCQKCHMKTNFNREYWTNYFNRSF